jgi:hypothetical protein
MEPSRSLNETRSSLFVFIVLFGFAVLSLGSCYISQRFDISFTTCILKRVTGIPCPFCGGTRAAWALLHGDIIGAVVMNPLATALCILVPPIYLLQRFLLKRRIAVIPRSAWVILITLLIANWAYLIHVGR